MLDNFCLSKCCERKNRGIFICKCVDLNEKTKLVTLSYRQNFQTNEKFGSVKRLEFEILIDFLSSLAPEEDI